MTKEELDSYIVIYQHEKFLPSPLQPIAKKDLIKGLTYKGICRNSEIALWDGQQFMYRRYKFGEYYDDYLNHFEDDDGSDVFIPFEIMRG